MLQSWLNYGCQVTEKTRVTGAVWDSIGQRPYKTFATETDTTVSVTRKLGEGITLEGTGSVFFLTPTAGFNVLVGDVKFSRTFAHGGNTVTPIVELQAYRLTNRVTVGGGLYPMIGAAYDRKIVGQLSLAMNGHEVWDINGGFGFRKRSNLIYLETGLAWTLTKSLTLTVPRIAFGGAWDDPSRPRKMTYAVGFAKTF